MIEIIELILDGAIIALGIVIIVMILKRNKRK